MVLTPRSALSASMSGFNSRIRSSIGRHCSRIRDSSDLVLAWASRFVFFFFMLLVVFGFGFVDRQACRLGSQTTNRIFNYEGDIPLRIPQLVQLRLGNTLRSLPV